MAQQHDEPEFKEMELATLRKDVDGPRYLRENILEAICEQLKQGIDLSHSNPITLFRREESGTYFYEILNGHHRVEAAIRAGKLTWWSAIWNELSISKRMELKLNSDNNSSSTAGEKLKILYCGLMAKYKSQVPSEGEIMNSTEENLLDILVPPKDADGKRTTNTWKSTWLILGLFGFRRQYVELPSRRVKLWFSHHNAILLLANLEPMEDEVFMTRYYQEKLTEHFLSLITLPNSSFILGKKKGSELSINQSYQIASALIRTRRTKYIEHIISVMKQKLNRANDVEDLRSAQCKDDLAAILPVISNATSLAEQFATDLEKNPLKRVIINQNDILILLRYSPLDFWGIFIGQLKSLPFLKPYELMVESNSQSSNRPWWEEFYFRNTDYMHFERRTYILKQLEVIKPSEFQSLLRNMRIYFEQAYSKSNSNGSRLAKKDSFSFTKAPYNLTVCNYPSTNWFNFVSLYSEQKADLVVLNPTNLTAWGEYLQLINNDLLYNIPPITQSNLCERVLSSALEIAADDAHIIIWCDLEHALRYKQLHVSKTLCSEGLTDVVICTTDGPELVKTGSIAHSRLQFFIIAAKNRPKVLTRSCHFPCAEVYWSFVDEISGSEKPARLIREILFSLAKPNQLIVEGFSRNVTCALAAISLDINLVSVGVDGKSTESLKAQFIEFCEESLELDRLRLKRGTQAVFEEIDDCLLASVGEKIPTLVLTCPNDWIPQFNDSLSSTSNKEDELADELSQEGSFESEPSWKRIKLVNHSSRNVKYQNAYQNEESSGHSTEW